MSTASPLPESVRVRIIRYDLISDGDSKSVNDAFTLATYELPSAGYWFTKINAGDMRGVRAFLRAQGFPPARGVTVDNGGDYGDRIELVDKHGDPVGAIAWEGGRVVSTATTVPVARMVAKGRYAMWGHLSHCIDALCEDGKRRTVRLGVDADTFFSWPGRASVGGRTVRGFVTSYEREEDGVRDYRFIIYKPKPTNEGAES